MFFPWLSLLDARNVLSYLKTPLETEPETPLSDDFVILVPIFNDIKYLTNLDFLEQYREKVIFCTTDQEPPSLELELDILRWRGYRVIRAETDDGSKNPWKIYQRTLAAHDLVLREASRSVDAEYVVMLDGDTRCEDDLRRVVGLAHQRDFDLSSVRVLPSRRRTLAEKMQGVEYDVAMRGRLTYPWLTSGAAMVAKTRALRDIMRDHSLFFNGGDIEIGKLARHRGLHIGHITSVFRTDVPPTFRRLFRQRISWSTGSFRHNVVNFDKNWQQPFYMVYFTFALYLMLPFKVMELAGHWRVMPVVIGLYMLINPLVNWPVRSRWMLLFPFYAGLQSLIMPVIGLYGYARTVIRSGNYGIIRPQLSLSRPRRALLYVRKMANLTAFAAMSWAAMTYLDADSLEPHLLRLQNQFAVVMHQLSASVF